ncbi:GTPase RsgA [Candidatus Woesearchaeota archaeon]|jgi:ribosome biogenesis GTPase A|nr:GTPase RsgA [Candidatus Woesearchaeota archaeon]
MPSFWKHVNKVLKEAEIIIEVLDARMVEDTRNFEIEKKIQTLGKKILYVFNKCDLVKDDKLKTIKGDLRPSVFISSKDKLGTTILKKKILEMSRGNAVTVGIVGYPNVGKSSLINALSGRGSAKTSSESGYTKGFQKIRVDSKILLLDTPGVLPRKEKDVTKHSRTGALSYGKIKDIEGVALELIADEKELILEFYKTVGGMDDEPEDILEQIAFKFKKLASGGKANLEVAARMLLKDWQTGKIKS